LHTSIVRLLDDIAPNLMYNINKGPFTLRGHWVVEATCLLSYSSTDKGYISSALGQKLDYHFVYRYNELENMIPRRKLSLAFSNFFSRLTSPTASAAALNCEQVQS